MRSLFIFIGFVILSALLVFASDFTPQGNINLMNYWNITNLNHIDSFNLSGNLYGQGYSIYADNFIGTNNISTTKNFVLNSASGQKICLESTCSHYIYYNGTHTIIH